ncbi:MAG: galactokinase [Phycisphaerales bacterium]
MHTPTPAPTLAELAAAADAGFQRAFGRAPNVLAQAPGRINIIGEHVDYQGGYVLPMAIDRWCVCAAAAGDDLAGLRIAALDLGETWQSPVLDGLSVGDAEDPSRGIVRRGSWASYVVGVVKLLLDEWPTSRPRGVQLAVTSSVPLGAGLSSSAALEVAVLTALERLAGGRLDAKAAAKLCQKAEHEFAGVACGIMDQMIACVALPGHAKVIDCPSLGHTPLRWPLHLSVLVINSGVRHALADGDYQRPQGLAIRAAAALDISSLGAVRHGLTPTQAVAFDARIAAMPEEVGRVARHHLTENARVKAVYRALLAGITDRVGQALIDSHRSLDENLHVSCPELNTIVAAAMEIPGVHGARMTGGGFGGCAIALVEPQAIEAATAHIRERYRDAHNRECDIFTVQAVGAAGPLN